MGISHKPICQIMSLSLLVISFLPLRLQLQAHSAVGEPLYHGSGVGQDSTFRYSALESSTNEAKSLGWTRNPANGHCYGLTDGGSWSQAEAQAVEWGGHLVTINSASENTWLVSTFGGSATYWIGYTDMHTEGQWRWISGESSSYTNWFRHVCGDWEPNDAGSGEDAAAINYHAHSDRRCCGGDCCAESGCIPGCTDAPCKNVEPGPEDGPGKWNDVPMNVTLRGIVERDSCCSHDELLTSHGTDILSTGVITRDSPDFAHLMFFQHPDVYVPDQEGTGADHMMQHSLAPPLLALVDLVNAEWDGKVQVLITEAWDEDWQHSNHGPVGQRCQDHPGDPQYCTSSHYEGRGMDIVPWNRTTAQTESDMMACLGGLAVAAGFHFVLNEGDHIHVTHRGWHTPPLEGASFTTYSPVDLVVQDPDGLVVGKADSDIPGALYIEIDIDGNGDPDDRVSIPGHRAGVYRIHVVPEPGALPTDTYSLRIVSGTEVVLSVDDIPVADVPDTPYVVTLIPPPPLYLPLVLMGRVH